MLKPAGLSVIGAILLAAGTSHAQVSEACMQDIVALLPHLANTAEVLMIEDETDFTLLAPSQDAAIALSQLLLSEGCEMLPMEEFADVAASWLIAGTQVTFDDIASAPQTFSPPTTQDGLSLSLLADDDTLLIGVLTTEGATNNVVSVAPGNADNSICGGFGTLHITDDVILPPAFLSRIRALADTPMSPCEAVEVAEAVEINEAFLADIEIELAGNKTTATIPVSAIVNSTAVDEDGNELAVDTEVMLVIDTDLNEVITAGGDISVQVPVDVSVNVLTEGCEDSVAITTPVDITIAVQLVVQGATVGNGNALMLMTCAAEDVGLFEQCGGMDGSTRFVSSCAGSDTICLSKNKFFAMCIPKTQMQRFVDRGWEAMQLECRA